MNHPSLVDEKEKTRALVTAYKREKGKRERRTYINRPQFVFMYTLKNYGQ